MKRKTITPLSLPSGLTLPSCTTSSWHRAAPTRCDFTPPKSEVWIISFYLVFCNVRLGSSLGCLSMKIGCVIFCLLICLDNMIRDRQKLYNGFVCHICDYKEVRPPSKHGFSFSRLSYKCDSISTIQNGKEIGYIYPIAVQLSSKCSMTSRVSRGTR
jgi:hypothetical protein